MNRKFLLCNFCNCRQHGIFQDIEDAKAEALAIYRRSRIKENYLLWHIVEFESSLGVRKKVDDHYFKIESFALHHGIAC